MRENVFPYIPNSLPSTKMKMLQEMGITSVEDLYADVPTKYRLKKPLNIPSEGLSEFEVRSRVEKLLSKNKTCRDMPVYLGAGCWPHYIPAVVSEIVQRNEFSTSYTPYQAEISQGILQALFEYQSMMCELTDMEVANCSMYDWASALGEAARMATRVKGRTEILIPHNVHPERAATLEVYAQPAGITVKRVSYRNDNGQVDLEDLKDKTTERTAAIYVENPSFLGVVESQVEEIREEAHTHGALFIAGIDPTSLGILKPPGEYGADIVVGEAQPLGNPMNFGGPLLGIMACRDDMTLIRQMPGRIIGLTTTQDGKEHGYCMTLQTREQHIRREKATSNICSNEALCAVASTVYLALLGPEGLRELGEIIMHNANYAMEVLSRIKGVKVPVFRSTHFKEFTVNFDGTGLSVKKINENLLKNNVHGGKDISTLFPELGQTALYCVSEIHCGAEINELGDKLEGFLARG